jgi:hypothetical protein
MLCRRTPLPSWLPGQVKHGVKHQRNEAAHNEQPGAPRCRAASQMSAGGTQRNSQRNASHPGGRGFEAA